MNDRRPPCCDAYLPASVRPLPGGHDPRLLNPNSYVVSFEGSRNDVVVLDKSCDVLRWLAGTDERAAAINDWYAKYHFTPISTVLGISSFLGFFVALMQDDQSNKKWWYWALAAAGVLLPANMLGSRSPRLLRMEATNFDMVTNRARAHPCVRVCMFM